MGFGGGALGSITCLTTGRTCTTSTCFSWPNGVILCLRMCQVVVGSIRHTATWMYWSGVLKGGWKRDSCLAPPSPAPGVGAAAAEDANALSADDCASPNSGSP